MLIKTAVSDSLIIDIRLVPLQWKLPCPSSRWYFPGSSWRKSRLAWWALRFSKAQLISFECGYSERLDHSSSSLHFIAGFLSLIKISTHLLPKFHHPCHKLLLAYQAVSTLWEKSALIHRYIRSLTCSLTCTFTHLLTLLLTMSLIYLLSGSFTYWYSY